MVYNYIISALRRRHSPKPQYTVTFRTQVALGTHNTKQSRRHRPGGFKRNWMLGENGNECTCSKALSPESF
jgi:hypothetical protein